MHMAERHIHHLADDLNRTNRLLTKTQTDNTINTSAVAFIAHIVSIDASGLAHLHLMADAAFHYCILIKILQRRFTDKAFFIHTSSLFAKIHFLFGLQQQGEKMSPKSKKIFSWTNGGRIRNLKNDKSLIFL